MRKWILVALMCFLVVVVASFAGCVYTSADEIEGTFYNNTSERVYVHCKNANTGAVTTQSCIADSSTSITLQVGTYDVTAKWYADDSSIDSDELVIEAGDDTFDIIVYNTTVTCHSY